MNHVRILFSLRLGSEAMELFDEKRERERERSARLETTPLAEHRATREKH